MRVRITKAKEQTYWYAGYVGETFPVIVTPGDNANGEYTLDNGENNMKILRRDCEKSHIRGNYY
jgi:hypothetical protein